MKTMKCGLFTQETLTMKSELGSVEKNMEMKESSFLKDQEDLVQPYSTQEVVTVEV